MKCRARRVLVVALSSGLATTSGMAQAECDPARPLAPIGSHFELNGDRVYDKTTDLTWMRCSYGQQWSDAGGCTGSAQLMDWDSAMGLHVPDNAAWRLPQRDELQSIVAHECKRPAINEAVFPATPSIQYWTSTISGPSYAWIIFFRTGTPTWTYAKVTQFAVRLVHEGR
jgi:Protein of unknown function (DUF1566)